MVTEYTIKEKILKGWTSPAVVLGHDGQFVLASHGGAYHRVHPCQLIKVKKDTVIQGHGSGRKQVEIQDTTSRNFKVADDNDL